MHHDSLRLDVVHSLQGLHVPLQGSQLSNAELLQYKRYLQKYVFAGWEAPDDLKEWVRMLERHILHADMQAEAELEEPSSDDILDPDADVLDDSHQGGSAVHQHHAKLDYHIVLDGCAATLREGYEPCSVAETLLHAVDCRFLLFKHPAMMQRSAYSTNGNILTAAMGTSPLHTSGSLLGKYMAAFR